jgi:uncharacterized protein
MIGELNNEQIDALLKQQVLARIACAHDDFIYLVPISYGYDGKYFYAHSPEGKKLEVMRKNPNICIEIDNISDMSNWESVIAWGKYEEIADPAEREKALRILLRRHLPLNSSVTTHLGATWPFSEDEISDIEGIVFRVELSGMTGRYECDSLPDPGYD